MSSVNKVILIGRIGRDPEIRYMQSGKAVANMSLATTSKRKTNDGTVEDTQWHRITMYEKLAEIAGQYAKKGGLVYIEGSIKYGKFTDKDGVEKNTVDIIANQMQLLSRVESSGEPRQRPQAAQQQQSFDNDEDVPF